MKHIGILVIAVCLLICPAVAIILPPVENPYIPICGDVNFFFWNDSSDMGAMYNMLAAYPQLEDDVILSATTSASLGEQTIGSFVTESFPNGKIMAPGLTRFRTFLNVSSAVGVTRFEFIPFNVSADGNETRLWYGVARTEDVDELVAREYLTSYARRNYTEFMPGDRLLIRVNVSTTSVAPRTAYFNVAGTSKASMVSVSYWLCPTGCGAVTIGATRCRC